MHVTCKEWWVLVLTSCHNSYRRRRPGARDKSVCKPDEMAFMAKNTNFELLFILSLKILKRGNLREEKMLTTISYQLQPEKTLYSENKIITMSWPSPNLNGLELNNKKTIISKKKSPTCYYCLWDLELTALPSPHLREYCYPQPLFR